MYPEYASKLAASSSDGCLFGCDCMYVRNSDTDENVSIGEFASGVSGAPIIKPIVSMYISSSVSAKICCNLLIAACMSDTDAPIAPRYKTSSVPMANSAVCNFPIRGFFFTVYPTDSKISRNSGQSESEALGGCVAGVADWVGGINVAGVFMFRRAGRDNGILGVIGCWGDGAVFCGVGGVTGCGVFWVAGTVGCFDGI